MEEARYCVMEFKNQFIKFDIIDGRFSNKSKLAALIRKQISLMDAFGKLDMVICDSKSVNARRYKIYCMGTYIKTDIVICNNGSVIIYSVNSKILSYISTGIATIVPYWNRKEYMKKIVMITTMITLFVMSFFLMVATIIIASMGFSLNTILISSFATILSVILSYRFAVFNGKISIK